MKSSCILPTSLWLMFRATCTPRSCPQLSAVWAVSAGWAAAGAAEETFTRLPFAQYSHGGMCKFKPLNRNPRRPTHQPVDPSSEFWKWFNIGSWMWWLCPPAPQVRSGALSHSETRRLLPKSARKWRRLLTSYITQCLSWARAACVRCKHHNGPIWNFPPLFASCLGSRIWGGWKYFLLLHP